MKLITDLKPHRIIADEDKHIRFKNDVYEPEHKDEEGNIVPEHYPYYFEIIYVPDTITEETMSEMFVEEEKGEM